MIITITPSGGTAETVGDDTSAEFISGLSVGCEFTVDIQQHARATHAGPVHRGNAIHTVSYRVERVHANEWDAVAFHLTHADDVTKEGRLDFFTNTGDPVKAFSEASLRSVTPVDPDTKNGVTTCFNYVWVCGASVDAAAGIDELGNILTDENGAPLII